MRPLVAALVPALVITGSWNWTKDQVRSQPVDTVPTIREQALSVSASPSNVMTIRRASPTIAAWHDVRRQEAAISAAVSLLGEDSCLFMRTAGTQVVDRNDAVLYSPSVEALATLAAALTELGVDWRPTTTLSGTEPVNGVISGNLTIVGGGDAQLGTNEISGDARSGTLQVTPVEALAGALVAIGIVEIDGDIVGDSSIFGDSVVTPGEATESAGLIIDDARVLSSPQNRGLDPAQTAARTFLEILREFGIEVNGSARTGVAKPEEVGLASVFGERLGQVVQSLISQNLDEGRWTTLIGNLAQQLEIARTTSTPQRAIVDILEDIDINASVNEDGDVVMSCRAIRQLVEALRSFGLELPPVLIDGFGDGDGISLIDSGVSTVVAESTGGTEVAGMGPVGNVRAAVSAVLAVLNRDGAVTAADAFAPSKVVASD